MPNVQSLQPEYKVPMKAGFAYFFYIEYICWRLLLYIADLLPAKMHMICSELLLLAVYIA